MTIAAAIVVTAVGILLVGCFAEGIIEMFESDRATTRRRPAPQEPTKTGGNHERYRENRNSDRGMVAGILDVSGGERNASGPSRGRVGLQGAAQSCEMASREPHRDRMSVLRRGNICERRHAGALWEKLPAMRSEASVWRDNNRRDADAARLCAADVREASRRVAGTEREGPTMRGAPSQLGRMPATLPLMGQAYRGFLGDTNVRVNSLYLMEALSPPTNYVLGEPKTLSFAEWLEQNRCRIDLLDEPEDDDPNTESMRHG